jgi:biotin transport system substrate-specific component
MQPALPIRLRALEYIEPVSDLPRSFTGRAVLAISATAFVAICAHVSLPLYFTPVPLTLQTFAVILIGFILGPALSFAAMLLYLAEGAMGLPVFSPHGLGGVAQLLGPTAGFLFSYPLAAAAAGFVVRVIRRSASQFPAAILAGIAASVFIFTMGAGWLAHWLHLSPSTAWHMAVAPFLPGEVLKVTAASGAYTTLRRWRRS